MANEISRPTMRFRWVDVSTIPQISTEMELQQFWMNSFDSDEPGEWVKVPFAGHINEASKTTLD